MAQTDTVNRSWKTVLAAALIVALLGLVAAIAGAADTTAQRLDRKVRVMERVIDEVLVQSPNVVVGPGGATRGVVLDEFGALFILDVGLGTEHLPGAHRIVISRRHSDEDVLVVPKPPLPPEPPVDEEDREEWEQWEADREKRQQEQLAAFKIELIDTLIDYGATLTELRDEHWVAVLASLDGGWLLGDSPQQRLMVKIKVRDLRQHGSGAVSREATVKKVVVEER